MNKRIALFLAILITLLVANNYYFFSEVTDNKKETVIVSRVIDGDTIDLKDGRKIRLLNINSPEKNTFGSNLSYEFLKDYENKSIEVDIIDTDKYDRYLARIYSNGNYLNLEIVNLGFASKFLVNEKELKEFSKAEKSAIENSKGIWKKSNFFGCLSSKVFPEEEYLVLSNTCSEDIELEDWILKDESTKFYKFKSLGIGRNRQILIYSLSGKDNLTSLFWNSETNVWNNDRDSLYLFDNEGRIASYFSYGY